MDIEKLTVLIAPLVQAIASKFPKFTRRGSLALAIVVPTIIVMVPGSLYLVANATKPGQQEDKKAATNLLPQPSVTTQTAYGGSRPVQLTFGPHNQGSPVIKTGDQVFLPPRYERVYQLESSGPDYPIFMSKTLAENNFVQGFTNMRDILAGATPDPNSTWDGMIGNQIKLDYNTEVKELPTDIDREISLIPRDRRFIAKFTVQSLAHVLIVNGTHKGKTGWVYRPLMREKRLPAVD